MIRIAPDTRERLRLARRRKGLTVDHLALITGIAADVVARALRGGRVAADVIAPLHWALGAPLPAPGGASPVPRIALGAGR